MNEYPHPRNAAATAVMRGNRSSDTKPEVILRSILHRRGARFRKGFRIVTPSLTVRPDIVFPRRHLVVFVDGCFWHGCPEHGSQPASNAEYWRQKFERNRNRDARVSEALISSGWEVMRIWEHVPPEEAAAQILQTLGP